MRLSNYHRGNDTGLCISCFNLSGDNVRNRSDGHTHEGYVFVKCANHPRATKEGFVKRAVLVLETKLGRHLSRSEHSHHLNGKRDDDGPENLAVVSSSEHARLHMKVRPNIKNRYQMALTQR